MSKVSIYATVIFWTNKRNYLTLHKFPIGASPCTKSKSSKAQVKGYKNWQDFDNLLTHRKITLRCTTYTYFFHLKFHRIFMYSVGVKIKTEKRHNFDNFLTNKKNNLTLHNFTICAFFLLS